LAIQMAKGEEFVTDEFISNGYQVPFIKLDVIAVTASNMKTTIIKDGFHKREDIYRD